MINNLTEKQVSAISETRQRWLNIANTGYFNQPGAFAFIKAIYSRFQPEMPAIFFFDSPMQSRLGVLYLRAITSKAQVWAQVRDQVRDQVWAQVWAQVGDQVWAQVGDQVWDQVGDQVGAQVWDQVRDQVGAQVRDQVGDQVWAQVGAQVRDQVWAQVWAQVGDQVWDQVGAQVRDQVGDQVWAQVGAQVGAQVWAQVRAQVRDQVGDQVWAQVWAQVGDQVWDQVGDQVGAQVGDQVWAQVGAQVRDQVWAQVWAQVGDQVGDQVWDQVGDQVGDQVWDQVGDQVWAQVGAQVGATMPASYINYSDFGWISFYDFFRRNTDLDFGHSIWEKFDELSAGMATGIYEIYPYRGICIVSRPPEKIFRDELGRIHNTEGPAIRFRDGFSVYAIHGRRLPAWIWEQRDTITRDKFLQEKNAEIRGGMYAVLGQKKVFDLIGAKEVCRKQANDETYILYRSKELIGDKYWQWVGVSCPSTGTNYLLGVPESVTCPIEAVAGTWGLSASEYIINQHT
jgi:hypothetical protein